MPSTHAQSHAHQPAAVPQQQQQQQHSATAAAHAHANAHAHAPAPSFSLPTSQFNTYTNYNAQLSSASSAIATSRDTPTPTRASHAHTQSSPSALFRKPSYADQNQRQFYQPQSTSSQRPIYDTLIPLSRTVYGGSSLSHTHANHASHAANSAPHISSALNYPTTTYSTTPATPKFSASLPRTSSLLPPPRITVNENSWNQQPVVDPFNASSTLPGLVNDRDPADDAVSAISPKNTNKGGSRTHSRSSSLGGLSEGFRNLNRWSISTTSSRASNATPGGARSRFSRRISVDSTALFQQSGQQVVSPRRVQKRPPLSAGASPEERKTFSIPPLAALPPILPLPSLEHEDFGRAVFEHQQARTDSEATYLGDEPGSIHDTSFLSTSARDRSDSVLPKSVFSRDATMAHSDNASATFVRGHQRSRSQGLKSSTDSATSPKTKSKQPSQKAMLSKALQKANTAVQLDNAQNFDGARSAYYEACELLQQVLDRTSGDDDQKKLEAIRKTYSSRIEELEQMLPESGDDGKSLPRTPADSTGYRSRSTSVASTTDGYAQSSTRQRSDSNRGQQSVPNYARPTSAAWRAQASAPSPKPMYDGPRYVTPTPSNFSDAYDRSQSSFSQSSPRRVQNMDNDMFLARPMEDEYMPPPLSPRRPISPTLPSDVPVRADLSSDKNRLAPDVGAPRGHQRGGSHESISWLDPIDESGGSSVSSIHSRSSSMGVRRKHIRASSGDTEAEFDAALDDAIEAAYDDGYEPAAPDDSGNGNVAHGPNGDDVVAQALRKVQLAKERVRQSELEMQRLATDRDRRMKAVQEEEQTLPRGFYDGHDSDEEERILEEMTEGYAIEDFAFDEQSKVRLPRESDSSEFTSRTWHSSTASNPPTANTVLSTVSEHATVPVLPEGPLAPPPTQSLPKLPPPRPKSSGKDSVRDRRLSGTNAKQLKIETQKLGPKVTEPATAGPKLQNTELPSSAQPKTAGYIAQQRQALSAGPSRAASLRRGVSPSPGMPVDGLPPTPPVPAGYQDPENRSASPALSRPPTLRKNFSSSSLKNTKTRNLSISNIDEYSDGSPGTPISNPFASASTRMPAVPALPTPVATSFRDRMTSGSAAGGGFNLFDAEISSPMMTSPVSGEAPAMSDTLPVPLEPCPKEALLRPFWLMRALYQTLCHPKGGYISNKLFVPRDAWRVKGVKIKNVEDKISQCDLLTAALQKLDMVNSVDADAVLEEMQSLESVLEQVQMFFSRRLGNEVGVQGSSALFKDADGPAEGSDGKPIPRNNSISSKGTFSWKRLRNKTSSSAISTSFGGSNGGSRKESSGAEAMLNTLPFTDHPTSRPSKRDVTAVQFSGPNAHYMAALARLFDAAQAIDQIARQVEDPGLRHQDKTQVGLELSTRHAAEFFGFYICRFVLQDLTMLLDKFIKRGSEWVLV